MWKKIKNAFISANNFLRGNRRRIAIIGSSLTSIGGLTGSVPLVVAGTAITALFGSLDAKDNKDAYKKLFGLKKKANG